FSVGSKRCTVQIGNRHMTVGGDRDNLHPSSYHSPPGGFINHEIRAASWMATSTVNIRHRRIEAQRVGSVRGRCDMERRVLPRRFRAAWIREAAVLRQGVTPDAAVPPFRPRLSRTAISIGE